MRSNIGVQNKQTHLHCTPSVCCHMADCKSRYTNLITNQVKRSKVGLRISSFFVNLLLLRTITNQELNLFVISERNEQL